MHKNPLPRIWKLAFATGSETVLTEILSGNINRAAVGLIVALPVHLLHALLFSGASADPSQSHWQEQIFSAHAAAAAACIPLLLAAWYIRGRPVRSAAVRLSFVLITMTWYLAFGTAVCLIDQALAPTPIAFLVVTVALASLFRIPIGFAAALFLSAAAACWWLLSNVQTNPAFLLSVRVNCVSASAVGLTISTVFWQYSRRNVEQHLQIQMQNRELEFLAVRDPLTQLFNRRRFTEALEAECLRIRRTDRPGGLLILDLDDFKQINDRWGHPAGDEVLRQTASALIRSVRATDMVARFGGEEFTILLLDTDKHGILESAERILGAVRDLRIPYQGEEIRLTASCGAALIETIPPDPAGTTIHAADEALYRAKTEGKDRTRTAFA